MADVAPFFSGDLALLYDSASVASCSLSRLGRVESNLGDVFEKIKNSSRVIFVVLTTTFCGIHLLYVF